MFLDPLGAIATVISGKMAADRAGKIAGATLEEADRWFQFGMSIFGTAFCSLFGAWAVATPALYTTGAGIWPALVLGFCAGLGTMAAMVYQLWVRSPLTKGIPLLVPAAVQKKAIETDTVYTEK